MGFFEGLERFFVALELLIHVFDFSLQADFLNRLGRFFGDLFDVRFAVPLDGFEGEDRYCHETAETPNQMQCFVEFHGGVLTKIS